MTNKATLAAQLGRLEGRGLVRSTQMRTRGGFDHVPPSGKHCRGRAEAYSHAWRGTSRTMNPAARRRANKRSWAKIIADARRDNATPKAVAE